MVESIENYAIDGFCVANWIEGALDRQLSIGTLRLADSQR